MNRTGQYLCFVLLSLDLCSASYYPKTYNLSNFLQFTYCLKAVTCVEMYGNQETCKYTHVKWIQTYKNKINDRAQANLDVFLVELE